MPSQLPPLRIKAWSAGFAPMFTLGDPLSVSVTPKYLDVGVAEVVLPLTHHRVPALMAPGVRVTIDYYVGRPASADYTDPDAWVQLISGPIWTRKADGPLAQGTITFGIEADDRILNGVLAWPTPTGAIGAQTSAYDKRSGSAEAVIKGYVRANALTRLALPIVVATSLDRGGPAELSARFSTLTDLLSPVAKLAGLGMTIYQDGSNGLVFDVTAGTDRTARVLSEAAGTITDWSFSTTGPGSTRRIIGGQGDDTTRVFRERAAGALETAWGVIIEALTDSPGEDTTTALDLAGDADLAATAPTAGVSVTVAETDVVRYGRNLLVGDLVAVQVTDSLLVTDTLSAATVTWSTDGGLVVEPTVGDGSTETVSELLVTAVSKALAGIRSLRASR